MSRAMILRIPPTLADQLRESWKALRECGEFEPGETLPDTLLGELINLVIRWGDRIYDATHEPEEEKP